MEMNSPMVNPTGAVRPEKAPPRRGMRVSRGPNEPPRRPKTGTSPDMVVFSDSNDPADFILVMTPAILSPSPTKPSDSLLSFPLMFSTPMASMIEAMAFWIRFLTFVIAVPMPPVADRACVSNEAKPSPPSVLSFNRALLKSPKETVPSFMAL